MRSFRIALLLIGLAGSSAILVAVRTSHRGAEDVAKPTRSLVGVTVRDAQHDVRALAPAGGGAVLVISATCPHCRATLGQLASGAAGASLAHLQIVTLEGTELGARLLDSLGIHAALSEPLDRQAFMRRLKLSSTPSLLYANADGSVRATIVGELSKAEIATLVSSLH